MKCKNIQQPPACRLAALLNLAQKPRAEILSAMRRAVRIIRRVPIAVRTRPLLIVATVKIAWPAPFFRTGHQSVRVDAFHHRRIVAKIGEYLGHRRADWMHIAMRRIPETPLIVHDVIKQTAVGRVAPLIRQMLHPTRLKVCVGSHVRIGGVVGRDEPTRMGCAVGSNAVARVRPPGVRTRLRSVFADGITRQARTIRSEFCHPANDGNGQHRLRAAAFRFLDKAVAIRARRAGAVSNAFKIPVRRVARGIDLPVVTGLRVAAGAMQGYIQILQ